MTIYTQDRTQIITTTTGKFYYCNANDGKFAICLRTPDIKDEIIGFYPTENCCKDILHDIFYNISGSYEMPKD